MMVNVPISLDNIKTNLDDLEVAVIKTVKLGTLKKKEIN